jgi:tetratricopeptide (TPR) repeat protein
MWAMTRLWTERLPLSLAVVVAVLAVLPYLNGLNGDFTFDDAGVIRDNPMIQRDSPLRLFVDPYYPGALYRPVTMLTYAANAGLGGDPFDYHVVNVTLHALASAGVLVLAGVFLSSTAGAFATAAIFAVHPVHTEAVSSIVGRAELLAALLVIVALIGAAREASASGPRRRAWRAVSLVSFALGLLAKESAFTAVGLVPLVDWWVRPRERGWRHLRAALPYAVIGIAYLGLRIALIGSLALPEPPGSLDNPLAHVALLPRLMTAIVVLWEYVAVLAAPVHLAADYSFNQVPIVLTPLDSRFLLALAGLLGVALGIALIAARRPEVLAAALLFLVPLGLTANVLFPIGTIKAERLLYLPSVGWCLGLGCLAETAARAKRRIWIPALAALVAVLGARTWLRNFDWRSNLILFTATARESPGSAKAHHNAAVAFERAGRLDEAMAEFRRSLAIYPQYASAAFGIGHVFSLKGLDAPALHWYEEAVRLDWTFAKAHLQIGLLRERLHEYDAAEAAFRAGLAGDPDDALLLVNLSAIRLTQGDRWGSLCLLSRLDDLGPVAPDVADLVAAARREVEEGARG